MQKRNVFNAIDRSDVWKKILAGKRVGLLTNPSGVDRDLRLTSDILHESGMLTCLFSPEHGVRGDMQAGVKIETYTDPKTGVPAYSLYGASKNVVPEVMETVDAIAFDIQDVGARFYTFMYSLSYVMEDCARYGKEVIIFDRINPLGGVKPEGNVLEPEFASFIGRYPLAARFNMTVGEFAKYINDTQNIKCNLTVIPADGWSRDCLFHETDLSWVAPSPNLPTPDSCFCYIGTCITEGTNMSEGRGTNHPFECIGAPWLDSDEVVSYMNSLGFEGVKFRPYHFTPTFSKHKGALCHGIQLHITDHRAFTPFDVGLYLVDHIRQTYPDFQFKQPESNGHIHMDDVFGSSEFRRDDFDIKEYLNRQAKKLAEYEQSIKPYYIY